jgi:L-fuconolactonase
MHDDVALSAAAQLADAAVIRIDAHQHFWRYRADEFPWMDESMPVLRRDWLPAELKPLMDAQGVHACLAVQARSTEVETDFLLGLAGEHRWIVGVVGWVDLRASDLQRRLDRWHQASRLVGFRHLLQDELDIEAFIADAAFHRGIDVLQAQGKVYEILLRAPQLQLAPAFCARHERHALVLDHLGKPSMGAGNDAAWRASLRQLGEMPHVFCKISGLVTEVVDGTVDETRLRHYLDTALECFGAQRLMFGSDWPVCQLRASYTQVHDIVARWSAQLGDDERLALWGGTASRCYGLLQADDGGDAWN